MISVYVILGLIYLFGIGYFINVYKELSPDDDSDYEHFITWSIISIGFITTPIWLPITLGYDLAKSHKIADESEEAKKESTP